MVQNKRYCAGLNRIALVISQSFLLFQFSASLSCYKVSNLPMDGSPQPSMSQECLETFGTSPGLLHREPSRFCIARKAISPIKSPLFSSISYARCAYSAAETKFKLSHTNEVKISYFYEIAPCASIAHSKSMYIYSPALH